MTTRFLILLSLFACGGDEDKPITHTGQVASCTHHYIEALKAWDQLHTYAVAKRNEELQYSVYTIREYTASFLGVAYNDNYARKLELFVSKPIPEHGEQLYQNAMRANAQLRQTCQPEL